MKRLKDPIYGYIEVETSIIDDIVDTPNFQRLRDIIQTSYSPLYASAVHNRFVHSLGVYYLGKMVANSIRCNFERPEFGHEQLDRYLQIFEYACLLHDVGHAPFSHTGEDYYLGANSSREPLHQDIVRLCGDKDLNEEIKTKGYSAAPHELMSVIVSLKTYGNLFVSYKEKSFFARCITGYKYVLNMTTEKSISNCIISLLNSSLIDVDKLDYLIRDAFVTGFDTVVIDYERLLKSMRIIKTDQAYSLVYSKGAISVIEDVIYAHDSERKWIQSHPVVLYDTYLLRHAIEVINKTYKNKHLFSYKYLTYEGGKISSNLKISLLSDGDLRFLMKNIEGDSVMDEYFSRKDRRHPLWKSEPEYKAIFKKAFSDKALNIMEEEFDQLGKYLNQIKCFGINEEAIHACEEDIIKAENLLESVSKEQLQVNLKIKQKHLMWLKALQAFAEEQKIKFDFIVIKANQFNSGFTKTDFSELEIDFPELKSCCKFKYITNVLSAQKSERDKFFYLFYTRTNRSCKVDINSLAKLLLSLITEEIFET